MKKIISLLLPFLLCSCGSKIDKIAIDYYEGGQTITVTLDEFDTLIKSKDNFVSYVTVDNLLGCGCSDSEIKLNEYAIEKNFTIYRMSLNMSKESYEADYINLLSITAEEGVNVIPELYRDADNKLITPLLPRLLVYSKGYLALNTDNGFSTKLNKYVEVTKN